MAERGTTAKEETLGEKPKIAIAGASGRLGQRLQVLLQGECTISPLQHQRAIASTQADQEIISGFDITDKETTNRIIDQLAANETTILINCTGIVNVDASQAEKFDLDAPTHMVNTKGAENLAEACWNSGLNLIHLSTEYVFDGRKPFGQKYSEEEKPYSGSGANHIWYGTTKAWAEEKVMLFPNSIILRVSQVQSPTSGLFAATLRQLERGQSFTRANNQLASTLTDETVAEALSQIMDRMRVPQEDKPLSHVYHISATDAYTPYEISLMLANAYGLGEQARRLIAPVTLEHLVDTGEQKVVRPKNSILDVSRFQAEFGPLPTIQEEIAHFKTLYEKP